MILNWGNFESYLREKMREQHIPGVAVAVSRNGNLLFGKGFGYSDLKSENKVTLDTIFGIASVTKSFTALAIIKLEEEGRLSIEDAVVDHLPELVIPSIKEMKEIKIFHLLTHTTGIAPLKRREELNKLREHIVYLSSEPHEVLGKPGEYFSYCNDSFILLGAIIERLTGKLFRRYITEVLLNELQLFRTTMSLEEVAKYDNVSTPYVWNMETESLEENPWPILGNYEVGGGIRSNALDLLKYGEVYCHEKRENGKIPASNVVKKMWENPFKITENNYYGFGWKVTPNYNSYTLVEHGGGQPGVSSNVGFIPEIGLVVVVLCNVSNVAANDIWLAAVNTALQIPLEQKRVEYKHKDDIVFDQLNRFVGTYTSKEGGYAAIYLKNHHPTLSTNGQEFSLQLVKEDTLLIKKLEKPITFFFKGEEKAWAILFGSRMFLRRER
ncbi:serine hydrolase domain-containing protein [Evansella tamaricis]|uniref:Beta-lactamase family protein n=1 Tax=Evansella tamaricis TaxID=2069301 RepID=A0ABS6JKS1_9BACI|nr:serine hydrolase domain-containing protein [Evansella tamaricis]MBU9713422.1 beta-lactamase family protein [Evansella tamaricis]